MKSLTYLVAFLTGGLFIFSGLIKLNDPVGTEIKLVEYFEVFQIDFAFAKSFWHFLVPHSLWLGALMSTLEVVLGVHLLIRYNVKNTLLSLLALVVFFTFLTFYSAYFNKVTDCGCFGEAIKLTPWQSFSKDVALLAALGFLWFNQTRLVPLFSNIIGLIISILATVMSSVLAYYTINHLPIIDFRNYKVGNNIPKLMQASAPLQYKYVMEKNGKITEFEQYPTDTTYKYKDMIIMNPEVMPKIKDFRVWNSENPDYTPEILKGKKLLFVLSDIQKAAVGVLPAVEKLGKELEKSGVKPLILTSASEADFEQFRHQWQVSIPYFLADKTLLKTMTRANPGLILLQNGVVKAHWHYNDLPTATQVVDITE